VNVEKAVEKAVATSLTIFPKLYYFVPPIEPFVVVVHPKKVKGLARTIKEPEAEATKVIIKDPLDAILFLIETLANERKAGTKTSCSQRDLFNLICRWSPMSLSQFSKELEKLRASGLIVKSQQADGDQRKKVITLTRKGKNILKKIKDQRAKIITSLFEGEIPEEINLMIFAIDKLGEVMWKRMKADKGKKRPSSVKSPNHRAKTKAAVG